MKRLALFLLLTTLSAIGAVAQTFEDCSGNYHRRFNEVQLKRTLHELDDDTADALLFELNATLDDCLIGSDAPDYSFVGRSGNIYTKESLKGKVVMMNFWSVNCGPCIMEIPVLNKLHFDYKDNQDLVLISVLLDKEEDLQRYLDGRFSKRQIFFDVVPNSKTAMKNDFKIVKSYPTNLFIDRQGRIYMRTTGGIIDKEDEPRLEAKLKAIIDEGLAMN